MIKTAESILKDLFSNLMQGIIPPKDEKPITTPEQLQEAAKQYD
jgi:hypothetical protein